MSIDLSLLPAPAVIEPLDYETILTNRKAALIALWPEDDRPALEATLALETEALTKFLEESAYRELLLRARINDAAHACMLAYATGSNLDQLVALLGVTRLPNESDERLRHRAQMALEGQTVAGSSGSYTYHSLSASALVKDVGVDSPAPGQVRITVLSTEGDGAPSPNLMATVLAYLSAEDRRPLTDQVIVQAAEVVPYTIEATLNVYPGPASSPILSAARAAVETYVLDHAKLGYDVTLSGLYACLHQGGVQRVVLASPLDNIAIGPHQAAHCSSIVISLGIIDV